VLGVDAIEQNPPPQAAWPAAGAESPSAWFFEGMLQTTLSNPGFDPSLSHYFSDSVVSRYTRFFGLGTADTEFLWVVDEAMAAPLPLAWEEGVSRKKGGRLYYFRAPATQSTWVHPVDRFYQVYLAKIRDQLQAVSGNQVIRSFTVRPPNVCIDVLNMCAFLDIPPEADYVWVALVALSVPLPPSWIQREVDLFENVETGELMRSNPLDYIFYAWVRDAEANAFGRSAGEWILPRLNSREAARVQPGKLLAYSFRQARAALVDAEILDSCGLQRMQPPEEFYSVLERNPSLAWAVPYARRAGDVVFCGGASSSSPLLQKSLRVGDLAYDPGDGTPNAYTAAPAFRQQGRTGASSLAQRGPGTQRECRATLSGRPENRHIYYKYTCWRMGMPDPYAPQGGASGTKGARGARGEKSGVGGTVGATGAAGAPAASSASSAPSVSSGDPDNVQELIVSIPDRGAPDPDLVSPHDFLTLVGSPGPATQAFGRSAIISSGRPGTPGTPGTPSLSASAGASRSPFGQSRTPETPHARPLRREAEDLSPTSYYQHQIAENRSGCGDPVARGGAAPEVRQISPLRRPRASGGLQTSDVGDRTRTLVARRDQPQGTAQKKGKPVATPVFSVSGRRSQCASVSSLPYSPAPACNRPESVERAVHAPQVAAYIQNLREERLEGQLEEKLEEKPQGSGESEVPGRGFGLTESCMNMVPTANLMNPSACQTPGDPDLVADDLDAGGRQPTPEELHSVASPVSAIASGGTMAPGPSPSLRRFSASAIPSPAASPADSPDGPASRRARSQRRSSARLVRTAFDGTPLAASARARATVAEAERSYSPQRSLSPTSRRDREAEAALKLKLLQHRDITLSPQIRLPIATDYVLAQLLPAPPAISFFYSSLNIDPELARSQFGRDSYTSFQVDPVNRIVYDTLPKGPLDQRFIMLRLRCKLEYERAADSAAQKEAAREPQQVASSDVSPASPASGSAAEMFDTAHSHPLFRDVHPWVQPTVTYYINDKVVDAQPSCSYWGHFINTADFNIGMPLLVSGKYKFILQGCDSFTLQWYVESLRSMHGVAQRVSAEISKCIGRATPYTPNYTMEQLTKGEVGLRKLANTVLSLFSELQKMKPSMKLAAFLK